MPECQGSEDCDDGNDCTGNACTDGMCEYTPVTNGTSCDESNECNVGTCNDGACDATPVADGTACGNDAGTCQQASCQVACTQQGILDAIAAGGGPYTFDCDGPTTVVIEGEISIDNDVILDGEGNLTVEDATPDVYDIFSLFTIIQDVEAELWGITISRADGGIRNEGTLTLRNCTVSETGGDDVTRGIWNTGAMVISDSIVSRNTSDFAAGILNQGTMTVTGSTISGNSSRVVSGIANPDDRGELILINSTVSNNEAGADGSQILNGGTLTIVNSTVGGNAAGTGHSLAGGASVLGSLIDGDCLLEDGATIVSVGYNIESPGDTCGFDQGTDQVNVNADDLKLDELADNGGPTMTHALLPGSVAIDVIPEAECVDADGAPLTSDQRGEPRDSMCDVGAFEVQPEL